MSRLRRMRDECVKNLAENRRIAAAAGDGGGHSELYQLMQMLVEANSICTQFNKHTVCHFLMLTFGIIS